jgi:hypothetical protein
MPSSHAHAGTHSARLTRLSQFAHLRRRSTTTRLCWKRDRVGHCRALAENANRSSVGLGFNVRAISIRARCRFLLSRTTFQRFAAMGSDRDGSPCRHRTTFRRFGAMGCDRDGVACSSDQHSRCLATTGSEGEREHKTPSRCAESALGTLFPSRAVRATSTKRGASPTLNFGQASRRSVAIAALAAMKAPSVRGAVAIIRSWSLIPRELLAARASSARRPSPGSPAATLRHRSPRK